MRFCLAKETVSRFPPSEVDHFNGSFQVPVDERHYASSIHKNLPRMMPESIVSFILHGIISLTELKLILTYSVSRAPQYLAQRFERFWVD